VLLHTVTFIGQSTGRIEGKGYKKFNYGLETIKELHFFELSKYNVFHFMVYQPLYSKRINRLSKNIEMLRSSDMSNTARK
jgi:hypothetical protein